MIFKLYKYINRANPIDVTSEDEHNEMVLGFVELYKQYGVKVIGMWNGNERKNNYYITMYRDEDHYQEFIQAMRQNDEYQRLSEVLHRWAETITSETLELEPMSPFFIDLVDYSAYIEEARKQLSET